VSAPHPVWLDAEGKVFGQPALAETRLPGRADLSPADLDVYVTELARALAEVHSVPVDRRRWRHAASQDGMISRRMKSGPPAADLAHPDGERVWMALAQLWPHVRTHSGSLLHGDYWPGNTLWQRGRLSGVVDWESPAIGDPDAEVGYCRQDLTMLFGREAADRFLVAYESVASRRVGALSFWDLHAVSKAFPDVVRWLPGYHDLGRTDITPELMVERHQEFIGRALAVDR
jgi:aminoglycoside phosphotransferase (APT) family kinase protein